MDTITITIIPVLDAVSVIAFSFALYILLTKSSVQFDKNSILCLSLSIVICIIVGVFNVIEHLNISSAFDSFEDYLEILFVLMFILFFYNLNMNRIIKERQRGEEALRESEEKYRMLIQHAPAGIYEVDLAKNKMTSVNDVVCEHTGYSRDELLSKSVLELLTQESKEKLILRTQKIAAGEKVPDTNEYQVVTKDGRKIWMLTNVKFFYEDDRPVRATVVAHNISDRKEAEEALRQSEERFRILFERAAVGVALISLNNQFVSVNKAYCDFLGYGEEELKKRTIKDITYPDDLAKNLALIESLRSGEIPNFELEKRFVCKNGDIKYGLLTASIIRDYQGNPLYFLGQVLDITERKKAEEALQQSEERYRTAIEHSIDGVALVAGEKYIFVNNRFAAIFGYNAPGEMIGLPVSTLVHPGDIERVKNYARLRQTGGLAPERYEHRSIHKDGSVIHIEVSATTTMYQGQRVSLCYVRDVSGQKKIELERAKLEEQLRQAQKMEAIGTLAGGIAHDFNNILAAILGHTDLALLDVPKGSPLKEDLAAIRESGIRARELVQQILAFSRKTEEKHRPIRMSSLMKETLKMLRASLPTTIEIRQHLKTETGMVNADPTQLHQILMNLCTNAAQAMSEHGGALDVGLEEVSLDGELAERYSDLPRGDYLLLRVRDTGHGIPPEIQERIFDPYFTTKEKGKGTGLGLAVVHGIVTSLGGAIRVRSEYGKGTVFEIMLRKVETIPSEEVIPEEKNLLFGAERILFVDDEEEIIQVGRRMLQRLGYMVVAEQNSENALELFKADPERFDLIITDMTMPNLTGDMLAQELMAVRPDIPIILCTGYTDRLSEDEAGQMGIKAFVYKPLRIWDLSVTIREILDNK